MPADYGRLSRGVDHGGPLGITCVVAEYMGISRLAAKEIQAGVKVCVYLVLFDGCAIDGYGVSRARVGV